MKVSVVTPATVDVWTPGPEMVVVKAADAVAGASHKQIAVSVRMLTLRIEWAFTLWPLLKFQTGHDSIESARVDVQLCRTFDE